MTDCTCMVFARSAKLHSPNCAKRQAYERQHPTPSERKAGKKERLKALVKQLRPNQHSVIDEQLPMLLGIHKGSK